MLNNMRIGPRLVLLIAVQTIVLAIIGVTAVLGLNFATDTTESLNILQMRFANGEITEQEYKKMKSVLGT